MKKINYFLQAFGYQDTIDFKNTVFKLLAGREGVQWGILSMTGGIITHITGLTIWVFYSFVILIALEFYTGIRVSLRVKSEKIQSRKMGRMFLKILVYLVLVSIINGFTKQGEMPDVLGVSLNPFVWLYYAVFIGIVFQLIISLLENLSMLGYNEAKGLLGIVLRKYKKWFEFDGEKNND